MAPIQAEIIQQKQKTPIHYNSSQDETDLSDRGRPPKRDGNGGGRGGCLVAQTATNQKLQLLAPLNTGLSTTSTPSFRVYVPYSFNSPTLALLSLRDENKGKEFIETVPFVLSEPGIIKIRLRKPLENNKRYSWWFKIICSKDDSDNPNANGFIKLSYPKANILNTLQKLPPRERAALYAKEGFWYDAVDILAELLNANPSDLQTNTDWADLLKSVGLEAVAKEKIISCCKPKEP